LKLNVKAGPLVDARDLKFVPWGHFQFRKLCFLALTGGIKMRIL